MHIILKIWLRQAVKLIFLRGAINYYIIGEDYKKASDTLELLKTNIKNLPPTEIIAVLKRAYSQGVLQKSPRLESSFQFAQAQMQAEDDIKKIKAHQKVFQTHSIAKIIILKI